MNKSKGRLESEISNAISQFEKEHLGRGPKETKAYIIQDMILVRLKGVLIPAEENLALEEDGIRIIKEFRNRLIENSRPLLEKIIEQCTGQKIKSIHTDISARSGERVLVFVLDSDLEDRISR